MAYAKIERAGWKDFCDSVSNALEGKLATLEIIGMDVGDQVEGERLALNGISYDPQNDELFISFQSSLRADFEHGVSAPQELYAEIDESGLSSFAIIEADGRKELLNLRDPLKMPASTAAP